MATLGQMKLCKDLMRGYAQPVFDKKNLVRGVVHVKLWKKKIK